LQYANDHRLDWTDRLPLLANLLPILQMVGKRRIESELLIARERGFQQVIEFYEDLQSKTEGIEYNHSALIQIGWGTGWKGMTIGEVLDKPVVDYLRQRYDLGKPPTWKRNEKGPWQANFGKPFPKSHRFSGGKSPQNPLGWVKISLTPYGKPRINDVWEMIQKMADEGIEPMQQFASVRDIAITITSKPAQPEASAIPFDITWMFSPERLPQPGDKFDSVLSTDGETFIVSLMGLDPDTEAYGELGKSDNPELPNLADGQLIRVEVLAVEKNRYGVLCVRCRLLQILRNRN